ncbi:MAG: hypothetical protein ACPKPY_09635 [Nitrososphaeraceae archaeon]
MTSKILRFKLPSYDEFRSMTSEDRLNIFRQYFATSRYNRLILQRYLIKSALDISYKDQITEYEKQHNSDFFNILDTVTEYGYKNEFLFAIKEEDESLIKIIEAYSQRMNFI